MSELTSHRQTVFQVVQQSHDHPTAREVFDRAQKKAPKLSFATVYNSLKFLSENGYIRAHNFGEDSARYDGMMERHDHLVCRVCGKVEDFTEIKPPQVGQDFVQPHGFKVEEISIQVSGVCQKCQ
jgi:Fur family peroxide stress response transcriptional regulator